MKEAVRAFRWVMARFEKGGQPLAAAQVAVDLAELLLRHGRWQDALALVKSSIPIFERFGCEARAFELWMDLLAGLLDRSSKPRYLRRVAAVRGALEAIHESWLDPWILPPIRRPVDR